MSKLKLNNIINEDIEYGSMWEGDFNSDASKQSWREFFQVWFSFGPAVAVSKELSTWHGERKLVTYKSPIPPSLVGELKLPENWKVDRIGSGTNAGDFIDGVEKDNNGEYITYNSPQGDLKFYLPNSRWFNQFNGSVYKFQTETGDVYTLVLSLNSQRDNSALMTGSDESSDNITISLKNLNPDNGNGWFFELPQNVTKGEREYFKKVSGNILVPFSIFSTEESLKSSWQLFWEKWGVVLQIAASVLLALLTDGLSLYIQAIFAEGSAIARLLPTMSAEVLSWLTTSGSFSVVRSEVLALLLLETSVNLPSAFIDKGFGNDFGFILGLAFCFFPLVSTYGRLGKWIKGSYSKEAAEKLSVKVLQKGFNQSTSQEVIYKFITEELTAEEKLMFSEGMKLLSEKEGVEAFAQSIKEAMENGAKNKEFPSKFKQFIHGGKWGETLKTLVVAGVYFIDVTKWYLLINNLKDIKKDKRETNEIILDAQKKVNSIDNKFTKANDGELELSSTDSIVGEYINTQDDSSGAELIFSLSTNNEETENFFINLVAQKKLDDLQKNIKNLETKGQITDTKITKILDAINELNSNLKSKKTEEEIYQWFNPETAKETTLDFFAKYDKDPMINQLKQTTTKYPCLATNFDYIDGWPYSEDEWVLNFKVIKPITIKYNQENTINLVVGDELWIYWPDGRFRLNDKEYNLFDCI